MKIVADANIPFAKDCFSSIGEVEVYAGGQITPQIVRNADVLLVRSVTKVNSDLLTDSKVRFVATATIGTEHIDIDYLDRRNIGFASAPGCNANSVAEYVIAALLNLAKKGSYDLADKSIGIVGVGNVGSKVSKKTAALGMKVCLNDPPLKRQTDNEKYLPLDELFDCDFITMHTPLTFAGQDKTFHLADDKFFRSLKAGYAFFNTSRGGVVDTAALKTDINSGKLDSTVLDVWENEPNIDTELLEIVDIATPHIAGYSYDSKIAGLIMVYNAVCEYFGLETKFQKQSFLPEPVLSQLAINPQSGSQQDILLNAVSRVYDITDDDVRLREILNEPTEKRGQFFSQLRKNYPVRREFQNTQIVLEPGNQSLAEKLAGIGFGVRDDKK